MGMGSSHGSRRGSSRGRSRRHGLNAEINVTPLVDVMLVLLIVFMITATVLANGVELELPKTDANSISTSQDPLTIAVNQDGLVYIQEEQISLEALPGKLLAIAKNGYDERIYLRGDKGADYGDIVKVMSRINAAGFFNLGLVTEPVSTR